MLVRYIEWHMYSPPQAFVAAVLSADSTEALIRDQEEACAEFESSYVSGIGPEHGA
jgi:hypothetical protein